VEVKRRSVEIHSGNITLSGDIWQPLCGGKQAGVVLLHGFASDRREMARPAVELARRGIVALTFDLRGHGQSGGVYAEDPVDDVLAAMAMLARQPSVDTTRLALVGHSIGGRLVLLAAAREPSVSAIVALAPAGDSNARELEGALETLPIDPVRYPDDYQPYSGESRQHSRMVASMRQMGYRLTVDWAKMAESWTGTPLADVIAAIAPRPLLLVYCLWDNKVSLYDTLSLYCSAGTGRHLLVSPWGVHSSAYRSALIRWLWITWLTRTLGQPAYRGTRSRVPVLMRRRVGGG